MVPKVEEKEDVRIFSHFYRFYFRFVFETAYEILIFTTSW